jgi:hypothetical protein
MIFAMDSRKLRFDGEIRGRVELLVWHLARDTFRSQSPGDTLTGP